MFSAINRFSTSAAPSATTSAPALAAADVAEADDDAQCPVTLLLFSSMHALSPSAENSAFALGDL